MSFAGGVGKTTLAVEAATLVGSRARYRTLDGEERPLKVLLLDAALTNPAAHLRLGLDPATVSKQLSRYDWPDAMTFERRAVETRFGVTLLSLPAPAQASVPSSFDDSAADLRRRQAVSSSSSPDPARGRPPPPSARPTLSGS
jgi:Mrp family chromosome partitioning ATPase